MFGNISDSDFLRNYWQKKPLLIRAGFPTFRDPISPEELAGLACEEAAESRLAFSENGKWRLRQGPFAESDFTSLPGANWTLLVQAVDHWFEDLKDLLVPIAFIPTWRVDDIMVSYATAGGGVGPHFDYYDVFIVQGQGSRTWKLGARCDSGSPLDTRSGLKILESFEEQESFEVHPGDVLYIPPGFSHQGISLDNSLSYSIGFRAPSEAEILAGYTATICAELNEDQRYRDPDLEPASRPGEISATHIDRLKELIDRHLGDRDAIGSWFGKYMTESKYPESAYLPEVLLSTEELAAGMAQGMKLCRHPAARIAFSRRNDELILFADGEALHFTEPDIPVQRLVEALTSDPAGGTLDSEFLHSNRCLEVLTQLYNQGSLIDVE